MDFWFHVRHIREEVVVTVNSTGSLGMQKAEYEEVTLNLRKGNWKAVVNGDFFQPSFHLFNNEVCCTAKRKLVLLSGVTLTLILRSNRHQSK